MFDASPTITPLVAAPGRDQPGRAAVSTRVRASAPSVARIDCLEDLFRGARRHCLRPGAALCVEGDPIDQVYQVVAGAARCCSIVEDGRRKIFRFSRARDFLGLADVDVWRFSVEAVDALVVRAAPRVDVERAMETSPAFRRAIRLHAVEALAERERQLTVLAFDPSEKRLLWFLRVFAERRGGDGFLTLPMTRQEIGDYLGMSLETVSRSFSALRRAGLIELKGAERYRFVDPDGRDV